jgi:hypothetical protein
MGNGLRLRITQNDGHKPKNKKRKSYYEKQKNILTYIVAVLSILVTSASSSPAAHGQTYHGTLTHGEFISCDGQILDPPPYSVGGTWVLNIDRMTEPQVPPSAHLTMIVFNNGSPYLVFPYIELTPISLQDGIYTYTYGSQVTVTLDTNTTPATFNWHVEFTDNCTLRTYESLTYIGLAN